MLLNIEISYIDGRKDGHTYAHLDGHTEIRTDPNCIVKKYSSLPKYKVIRISGINHQPDVQYPARSVSTSYKNIKITSY